jgi:defect-in-organelle-trafficking protein DotD
MINMKFGIITAALCFALGLGGCTSIKASVPNKKADPTSSSLAESASSVSQSIVNLAQTEQAANPVGAGPAPDPSSYGMGATTSIDWSGPIAPLVQKIAQATHYRLKIIGKEPAIPVLVTVLANNEKIGNILLDVGFQAGKRASVVVYPSTQVIQLRYSGN